MKFKKWLGLILSLAMVLAVSAGVAACGAETSTPKPEHTYSEEWSHDADHHWHACETHPDDTTDVKGRAAHVDVQEGGDGKCDVCGADMTPPEPEHVYAEGWSHDENSHWHACETHPDDPNDVTEKAGHVDEEGEDGKCDVCGADMTPPEPDHVYAEGWTSDDNYHWHACETHPDDPNDVTEKDGHVDVVDGGDGYCDVCNHAMPKTEPEPEHEHSYTAWEVSEQPAEGHPGKATRHCEDPDCDHSEGEFQEEELPALDEGEYEVEHDLPSCDHEGTDTYTYTLQDGSEVSFTVTVDKIAHSYGDPQWTWNGDEKTGYTGASVKFVCDVCGDEQEPNVEFTRQTVQSGCAQQTVYTATAQFNERQYQDQKSVDTDENAHNHGTGYGELIPQQDPTCTEPGVKAHFHCEVCEKDFDEEHNDITGNLSIDALGHDYTESEWVVKLIPTAGEQGRAEKACKRAGNDEAHEKLTVALPVLGDGRYVITENTAKCVATGTGTYTITLEEGTFTFTAETPALGHDYEKSEWTVELIPTESVEGRAERTCSREGCDDHEGSKESESIPALNRSDVYTSDKIQEKSPATCTKDGTDIYSYTLKDGTTTVTFEVTVPKTGHAYPEEWEITPPTADNTGTATKTCPNCTDEEGHTITVTLPKLSEEEKYTAVTEDTATCTKGGERTYTYHDETYSDDYGDIEFTVQTSVKAHTYNGWKHDDTNHWQQCEVCEEETAHEPHTFEEGYCDTCGAYEKYTLTFDLGDAKDEDLKPVEDKVVYANEPDVNLPGAPTREGFNFKGWECEADSQIYDANHKYTAKGNTKFTAQWEEISAKQCPYNFYITGNGAGDLSRSGAFGERVDQFRLTPSMSGDNTVYTFDSIEIFEGGNFKIISDMDPKDIWAEGTYFSYGGLTKTNPNFKSSDGSSNGNIQATVSGRYKIVLTVDQKGNKISFEITTLQTYTNVKNQFKGYYLTGFMTDPAWVQEPTAYELKGSGSTYTGVFYGVFYLDTAASHATDGKTEVKVIKVTAIMVEDREAGYTVEWYPLKGGDNYTVPATGWYKFTLTVSASGSTFTAKTATEHTHKYTWEITNPTEEGTGQAIGTCNGSGDVPCDKKEVTLTIPSLSDLAKKDINGEGKHSCTEQYTLHYKVTLQDEDETKYEVEFDITHDADPHATDGTWQSDATHHWYECANCDTHVEEAEHEFVGHVCSECSYEAKKVTAHFDVNYKGAETIGDTVEYADYKHESITLPEPNARTGYEFNGWLLNKEGEPQKGSYNITFTDKDTELSFTAKWTAIVYNVTFTSEVQGATLPETPKTTSLEENATFTLAALTLKGYKFDGWFVGGKALSTNEAGAYTFTLNEETIKTAVEKTITVTAKWEANKYTVVFAHDPATVDGEEVTNMPNVEGGVITVEEGKNTITLTKPVRDGYTFVEWQRGNGDTVKLTGETAEYKLTAEKVPTDGTITFTAKWTVNEYHVTYDLKGGTGTVEDGKAYHIRDEVTISDVEPTRTGYTFTGWKVKGGDETVYKKDGEGTQKSYTMKAADVTFEAQWTAKEYTIKFDVNKPKDAEGEINETPANQTGVTLEKSTITLATLTGLNTHTFNGWTLVKGTGKAMKDSTNLTAEMIAKEAEGVITLYASWTKNGDVTATFSYGDWDGAPAAPASETGTAGTTFSMPEAAERTGYVFKGWKEDNKDEDPIQPKTEVQLSATSYTAQWEAIKYKIVLGGTTLEDVTLDNAATEGKTFADPATRKGYKFDGWKLNGVGDKYEKLTAALIEAAKLIDEAHTITLTAAWTAITYTVKLSVVAPKEGVGVDKSVESTVLQGALEGDHTTFDLPTPTAPTGYKFTGWKLSEGKIYQAGNTTFEEGMIPEQGETITLTTTWSLIEYKIVFEGATAEQAPTIESVTLDTADSNTFPTKETLTKLGYEFASWKLKGHVDVGDPAYTKLTTALIEAAKPEDESHTITLVAQWTSVKYTVVYSAGVDEEIEVPTDGNTYALDGEKTITVAKMTGTRTGYDFSKWAIGGKQYDAEATIDLADVIEHATVVDGANVITLTADWAKHQFTVTFTTDYGTLTQGSVKVEYQGTLTLANYTIDDVNDAETHKHFRGWAYQETSTEPITDDTITITEDVTLVAVWEDMIKVTFEIDGKENVEKWFVKEHELEGNDYPEAEKAGHRFDGWLKDGQPYTASALIEDITLTAKFVEQVTITFEYMNVSGTTISNRNARLTTAATILLDKGTAFSDADSHASQAAWPTVTVTASVFDGWYFGATKFTATTKITENVTLTGKFTKKSGAAEDKMEYTLIGVSGGYDSIRLNDWDQGGPATGDNLKFSKQENVANNGYTIYTIEVALTANKQFKVMFKSATGSWAWGTYGNLELNDKNLIAGTGANAGLFKTAGGSNGNGNNLIAAKTGIYRITLYTNPNTTTSTLAKDSTSMICYELLQTVSSFTQTEHNVYVRGDLNNWLNDSGADWAKYKMTRSGTKYTFDVTAHAGDELKVFDLFTREWIGGEDANNYKFEEEGSYRITYDSSASTKKITVLKLEDYTYQYSLGAGYAGSSDVPAGGTVHSATPEITLPEAPVWDGYRFKGWQVGSDPTLHDAETQVNVPAKDTTITAVWAKQITITFGETGGSVTIDENTSVGTEKWVQVPDKVGYKDGKWMNGDLEATAETAFSADTTLTASYTPIDYTLSFVDEKGEGHDPETVNLDTCHDGAAHTLPSLKLTGYDFKGWTWDGQADPTDTFTLTPELIGKLVDESTTFTLTAQWKAREYTVEFVHDPVLGSEEQVDGMPKAEYKVSLDDPETKIDLTYTELTRANYKFSYWTIQGVSNNYHSEKVDFIADMIIEGNDKIVVTAHWTEASKLSVSFSANGGEQGTMPQGEQVTQGTLYTIPAGEPTRTGYTFDGWYVGDDQNTLYKHDDPVHGSYTVNDDVEFKAKWSPIFYTLTFTDSVHSQSADPIEGVTVESSATALRTVDVKGYDLVAWTNNTTRIESDNFTSFCLGEHKELIPADGTTTINFTAVWEATVYDVTFESVHGSLNVEQTTVSLAQPLVKLETLSATGYIFNGWKRNGEAEAIKTSYTLILDDIEEDDSSFSLKFVADWTEITYTVTFNPGAHAATSAKATTKEAKFTEGYKVTAPAAPTAASGYKFVEWKLTSGNGTASVGASGSVTVSSAATYTAQWEATSDKITVSFNYSLWDQWGSFSTYGMYGYYYDGAGEIFTGGWDGRPSFANGSGSTKDGYTWQVTNHTSSHIYTITFTVPANRYTNVVLIITAKQSGSNFRLHKMKLTSKTVSVSINAYDKESGGSKYCSITGTGYSDIEDYT